MYAITNISIGPVSTFELLLYFVTLFSYIEHANQGLFLASDFYAHQTIFGWIEETVKTKEKHIIIDGCTKNNRQTYFYFNTFAIDKRINITGVLVK